MTVQWIENGRVDDLVDLTHASATSAHPDYHFPQPYFDAVIDADRRELMADFAQFADDALEWAQETLPAAAIHIEE